MPGQYRQWLARRTPIGFTVPLWRRLLAGPQLGISLTGSLSFVVNPLHSPIGRNVTWESPILARYTGASVSSSRFRDLPASLVC